MKKFPRAAVAAGLLLAAILLRYLVAPSFQRLPADYKSETQHAAKCRYRPSPTGEWEDLDLIATRVDQTLVTAAGISKIQGHIDWTMPSGEVTYESSGLYGVDRKNRANLPGFGNRDRAGQYLFPPHAEKKTYKLWDPFYTGPRTATFNRVEPRNGLAVYLFDTKTADIDDTEGYLPLPDVPEKYHAFSAGAGKLWIEPQSGVVVDFEDVGKSYFVDAKSGAALADFYFWDAHYTPETKAVQTRIASAMRRRALALEVWLPLAFVAAGLAGLAIGFRTNRPHAA